MLFVSLEGSVRDWEWSAGGSVSAMATVLLDSLGWD